VSLVRQFLKAPIVYPDRMEDFAQGFGFFSKDEKSKLLDALMSSRHLPLLYGWKQVQGKDSTMQQDTRCFRLGTQVLWLPVLIEHL